MTKLSIPTICPICRETHYVPVPLEGYRAWENGDLIQDAMPDLTANEREMLISGICPECWENMWGDDDDEESAGDE